MRGHRCWDHAACCHMVSGYPFAQLPLQFGLIESDYVVWDPGPRTISALNRVSNGPSLERIVAIWAEGREFAGDEGDVTLATFRDDDDDGPLSLQKLPWPRLAKPPRPCSDPKRKT